MAAEPPTRAREHRAETQSAFEFELLDLVDDAVIVREPIESRVTFWNREAEAVYGFSKSDAAGEVIHDLLQTVFPDSREAVDEALARDGQWKGELRHTRKDGREILVSSRQAVRRDPDGRATAIIELNSDITERRAAERGVRERAALIDLSSDAVFVCLVGSRQLTFWSTGAQRLYGYSPEQALGRAPHELLATRWPQGLEAVTESLARTGRWEGELTHRAADGRELTVLCRQAVQNDDAGVPTAILEINTDITERTRREQELAVAEARWRGLVDNLPDAAVLIFDEDLRYIEARGPVLATLGIPPFDLIGQPPVSRELPPGAHLSYPPSKIRSAFRQALAGEASRFEARTSDHVLDVRVVPLELGDGRRGGMVLSVDVTDRDRAEANRLRTLLETASDPIFGIDGAGRITFASPSVLTVLGYRPEELVGQSIEVLVPERLRGIHRTHRNSFQAAPTSRALAGRELLARRKDGSEVPVEISLGVADETAEGSTTAVMVDISERLKLADQLRQVQKLEAVGQLAGGVAHDFNNLLMVILGYTADARQAIGDGSAADSLLEVTRAADRAAQLTRQLLAFSRRQMLRPVDLDLSAVARGLVPMLGRVIGEDIEITLAVADDLPPVRADQGQIEQVIVNLAVNARDAMPTGGRLTIETHALDIDQTQSDHEFDITTGHYVCLTLTDSGSGIPPDVLEHVFEPFFTTKEVGSGTGLGLATVHGIVTQSAGHIRVYSEPGLGAAFKIYLPATIVPSSSTDHAPASGTAQPARGTETLLLCEDEEAVRRLMVRILSAEGYTVLTACTPEEALNLATYNADAIDLLVSDVIMPGLSGPELANRLRQHIPNLRTLFVSGHTPETVRSRGNLMQGSTLLQKPFTAQALGQTVRDLLDRPAELRADRPPLHSSKGP